jgi:GT2 family glycosyltransferase
MPVKAYHERYLRAAVGSMVGQTSRDWRLLVVTEPGERSRLEDALGESLADPRVELVLNEGRKLAGAFNTGMRRAETEYVAILLGDDLWAPEAVETLTRHMTDAPATDFFHSARRVVDEEGRAIGQVHPSRPEVSTDDFAQGFSPVKHLLCWRREAGLAVGGMDESLNSVGVDDFDFPWTMAESGARFGAIPECLYVYRDHRDCFRLTTHLPRNHHRREVARIMRKHGVARPAIRRVVDDAGKTYLGQCLYRSRTDRLLKRVRGHDPRRGWRYYA